MEKKSFTRRVHERLAGSWPALSYVVIAGALPIIPDLVVPAFSKLFIDEVLIRNQRDWMVPLLWGFVLVAALRAAFKAAQERAMIRLDLKLAVSSSSKFSWHLLRLPMEFFSERMTGDLVDRAATNAAVSSAIVSSAVNAPTSLLLVLFYSAAMFYLSPMLAAMVVAISTINLVALRLVGRYRKDQSRRVAKLRGKLNGVSSGGLELIETIKATGSESDFFSKWYGHHALMTNARQELQRATFLLQEITPMLGAINTAVVLGVGADRVISGEMTMGSLVAFQFLANSFFAPFRSLTELGRNIQELDGELERIDEVSTCPEDIQFSVEPAQFTAGAKLSGHVALSNVTFGYDRRRPPLIKELSISIQPGDRIAIVGRSGSGKTTVGRLICGTLQPWSGEIMFSNIPRNRIPRPIFANSVGLVEQNIALYQGTVRENITCWDPTLTDFEIIRAAKDACIHDEITKRSGRYDSRVEENGSNFSGGQRQRLEIARALVRSPAILVLDEATSALDPHTEQLIDDNLRRRGSTCIIIAHRLSTIRSCDEIIVLDEGRIVQRGAHEELLAEGGIYAQLMAAVA